MRDEKEQLATNPAKVESRVLRHMMHETIDLLDRSTDHADEACLDTNAAMTLTRVDWTLMAVFNWLTDQLRGSQNPNGHKPLGQPVSIVGIDQTELSIELRNYAQTVDRLYARIGKLDNLLISGPESSEGEVTTPKKTGVVLNIFGDPEPSKLNQNQILETRQRLKLAFGG